MTPRFVAECYECRNGLKVFTVERERAVWLDGHRGCETDTYRLMPVR